MSYGLWDDGIRPFNHDGRESGACILAVAWTMFLSLMLVGFRIGKLVKW